jgi:hypothetical protein
MWKSGSKIGLKSQRAWQYLHDSENINMDWENIGENIIKELGSVHVIMKESSIVCGLMQNIQNLEVKMKQAKLQWLQDPIQIHII